MTKSKTNRTYLPDLVGGGYGEFWRCRKRYRVVKGSRASKKSKTTALWIISSMMADQYREANVLVIRKVFRTIQDSCFTDLRWAVDLLGVSDSWEFKLSPLEATYKPTGQKILFRGLDDPQKIASVAVKQGVLCWAWIEEAYEIMREADFDMIDESIRGVANGALFKQITLTFNPWNERHWLKRRFFDVESEDVFATTTNYLCNEWLDDSDRKVFDEMKIRNPRRYQVAALGNWGVVEGLVYENWEEQGFAIGDIQKKHPDLQSVNGLDFGYTNDPSAGFVGFASKADRIIYVWDELYEKGLTNRMLHGKLLTMGYGKEMWIADSAEPKSIDELRGYGLRIKGARKGRDSINNGIQHIQNYKIIIHPRCVNFLTEISNYTFEVDRFGKTLNAPIDDFNHLMDAMRYGMEPLIEGATVKLKTFKL